MALFDINSFEQKYGINTAPVQLNRNNLATMGAPKKASAFSPGNLGHSIAAIPSSVGKFIAGSVNKIPAFIKGGQQGLPVIGQISQNQKFHDQQMKAVDAAEHSYTQQLRAGKIDKARYRKLMSDLSKDRSRVTDNLTKQAKDYVAPSDFIEGAVQTAGLLPAAGAFTKGAAAARAAQKGIGYAAKRALIAPAKQAVISAPVAKAASDASKGKNIPENIALAGASVVAPGAVKLVGKAAKGVKNVFFDSSGLFDHVHLAGGQSVNQALKGAEQAVARGEMSSSKYKTIVSHLKVSQDQNLSNHGSPTAAAKVINESQAAAGRPTHGMTLEQFALDQGKLAKADKATQSLFGQGNLYTADGKAVKDSLAPKLTVGKASQSDKAQIAARFEQAAKTGSPLGDYAQIRSDFPDFFRNKNNAASIEKILTEAKTPKEIKARINSEITGTNELFTKNAAGELVPAKHAGGYHSIVAQNATAPFRTPGEVADVSFGNKAPLGAVGSAIRKTGLSPEPTDRVALTNALKSNFNNEIDGIKGLEGKGDDIYSALGKMLKQGPTGSSERSLLTKNEIEQALNSVNVGGEYSKAVRKALDRAHLSLPAELRGAGGKLTDFLTAKLPGERKLLRAQQIGRFSGLNPFFQTKVALKSEALAQAYSGGHLPFNKVPADIDKYVSESGLKRLFAQNFTDFVGDYPNVNTGTIGKVQQNIAGRMVDQMLKNHGVGVDDLYKQPALKHEIDHAIETVFGYPKGGFLDSNFAKAMNVVIFPFRFETKVMTAMGHFLLKQDPVTRMALTTGIVQADHWLKSPEGQNWQHNNSELATIARYFTPVETVGHLVEMLSGKSVKLTDVGLLGGLPLGFVTTILEGQGADLGPLGSSEFRDPKTGELVPQRVPADQATRVKKGLTDLINSMYSYPGKQLGLSSKSDIVQTLIPPLKKGKYQQKAEASAKPKAPEASKVANVPQGPLFKPSLSAAQKAAIRAKATPKPKKGPKVKNKAVKPGQPF